VDAAAAPVCDTPRLRIQWKVLRQKGCADGGATGRHLLTRLLRDVRIGRKPRFHPVGFAPLRQPVTRLAGADGPTERTEGVTTLRPSWGSSDSYSEEPHTCVCGTCAAVQLPTTGFLCTMLCIKLWRNPACLWTSCRALWATRRGDENVEEKAARALCIDRGAATNLHTPSLRGRRDRTETEDPAGGVSAPSRQSVTRLAGSDGPTGGAGVTVTAHRGAPQTHTLRSPTPLCAHV
jgi:hypothetical protein